MEDASVTRDQGHADGGVIECGLEAVFAAREGALGSLALVDLGSQLLVSASNPRIHPRELVGQLVRAMEVARVMARRKHQRECRQRHNRTEQRRVRGRQGEKPGASGCQ